MSVLPDFTLDELLAFLEQEEPGEQYRKSSEWADYFGISQKRMMALLHAAKERGVLLVAKAKRETLDGHEQRMSVYAFKISARIENREESET